MWQTVRACMSRHGRPVGAWINIVRSSSNKLESSDATSTVGEPAKETSDLTKTLERKVINAYEHNLPQLMEFFDNPKNWNESDVKSGKCIKCLR